VRDTRGLIAAGILVGIVGAVVFVADGNDHTLCSSVLTAWTQACGRVNALYDGGIVAMVAGGLMFAVGMITYRPGTQRSERIGDP
jgi:hypothetical protein